MRFFSGKHFFLEMLVIYLKNVIETDTSEKDVGHSRSKVPEPCQELFITIDKFLVKDLLFRGVRRTKHTILRKLKGEVLQKEILIYVSFEYQLILY